MMLYKRFALVKSRRASGFTLIELMVGVSIGAIVCGVLVSLIMQCLSGWQSGTGAACAETEGDVALGKLLTEIRDAKSASVNAGVLTVVFPLLYQDAGSGESYYQNEVDGEARQYYLSNGILQRRVNSHVTPVARNVSAVSFSVSGHVVTLAITTRESVGSSCTTRSFSGRVVLRNARS